MQRILEAFGEIDERYLVSAMSCERRPIKRWRLRVAALAACLCLVMTGAWVWRSVQPSDDALDSSVKLAWSPGESFSEYRRVEGAFLDCTETSASFRLKNISPSAVIPNIRLFAKSTLGMALMEEIAEIRFDESCFGDGEGLFCVYLNGVKVESFDDLTMQTDGQEYVLTIDYSRAAEVYEYVMFVHFEERLFVLPDCEKWSNNYREEYFSHQTTE